MKSVRLGKVTHYRCSDYDGYSYLIIPDGKTEDDFLKDAQAARDDHVRDIETYERQQVVKFPKSSLDLDAPIVSLDTSIRELKQKYEKELAAWKKYEEARKEATLSFESHMIKRGYRFLYSLEDTEELTEVEVSWGHMHGAGISYDTSGETSYCYTSSKKP